MEALLLTCVTFFSTLLGGAFALRHRTQLHFIMSFTAGVVIGVCFFDLLPEIVSLTREGNGSFTPVSVAIVAGYLVFHVLETTISIHGSHEGEYATHVHPSVGVLSASGLSFHSFLDGVGIGLGFQVSNGAGLVVAIAVISHDFADGLNTVTLMLANHNTSKRSLLFLALDATTPLLGVLSTFLVHVPGSVLRIYLGFFAGFLLYIGASDLLPEAHSSHSSYRMVLLTLAGALFIFVATRFA